eukprot:COSAG04_NODE_2524_length_3973_cov_29.653846_2_plen_378_part_00
MLLRALARRGAAAVPRRAPLAVLRAPPLVRARFFSALPASADSDDDAPKMDRLHVIMDQSGSMQSMTGTVYEGARELLDGVADDGTVCVTRFSSQVALGTDTTPAIAQASWAPGECSGLTALYDAITAAIDSDLQRHADLESVTIAIVTDGIENASQRSLTEVKEKIEATDEKGWRVVFLGSNQDAVLTAETMGIRHGHSMTYGNTRDEVRGAFQSMSAANRRYRSGRNDDFTHTERQQAHAAHVAPEEPVDVDLGFESEGQTKWVSIDPRTGELTEFDKAASNDLEYAWNTQQSTASIALRPNPRAKPTSAVVFFENDGNHNQKTKGGERCVRCVSKGDTILTRVFGGNGHRVVDVVEAGQQMRQIAPGTKPIIVV